MVSQITPPHGVEAVVLKHSYEGFGMVLDLLSRAEPFLRYELGNIGASVRLQLKLGHHVAAMAGKGLVGYVGWLPTTAEIAGAWLADRGTLTPVLDRDVDAGALTIVLARDAAVMRYLIRLTRDRNRGKRVFFKRTDGSESERKVTVLNYYRN